MSQQAPRTDLAAGQARFAVPMDRRLVAAHPLSVPASQPGGDGGGPRRSRGVFQVSEVREQRTARDTQSYGLPDVRE